MKKIITLGLRFILGGAPGLVLNFLILHLSSIFLSKDSKEMMVISVIAFILKEILSFTMHKLWTFEKTGKEDLIIPKEELRKEAISYVFSLILITTANTVALYMFIKATNWQMDSSQAFISLTFFFVNFPAIYQVFKKTQPYN